MKTALWLVLTTLICAALTAVLYVIGKVALYDYQLLSKALK